MLTTETWLAAINDKNLPVAVALFEPDKRKLMAWADGSTSSWPKYSAVRCRTLSRTGTSAVVSCSFRETNAAAQGGAVTFWNVSLGRQAQDRWLISGYGQG